MDHACYYRDGSGVYDVFEEHLCEYYITISIKHFVIRAIRLPPRVKNFYFSTNISAFSLLSANINFFAILPSLRVSKKIEPSLSALDARFVWTISELFLTGTF